ncbi:MAG TPA: DNA methyltransferase [Verrucomicrobiae bacterium]|nr:DNA methyltransferase [Verrucomicrobiae bacterium]
MIVNGFRQWRKVVQLDAKAKPVQKTSNTGSREVVIDADPPYRKTDAELDKTNWKLFEDLAKFADKHLKPNRPLVLMLGSLSARQIESVIVRNGFKLWWTCVVLYDRFSKIKNPRVNTFYKPVLVFVRNGDRLLRRDNKKHMIYRDAFKAGERVEYAQHKDQQDVETFQELVKLFSFKGELVCDPCMGSGTTGIACLTSDGRRRFCGAENDQSGKNTFKKAVNRLKAAYASGR